MLFWSTKLTLFCCLPASLHILESGPMAYLCVCFEGMWNWHWHESVVDFHVGLFIWSGVAFILFHFLLAFLSYRIISVAQKWQITAFRCDSHEYTKYCLLECRREFWSSTSCKSLTITEPLSPRYIMIKQLIRKCLCYSLPVRHSSDGTKLCGFPKRFRFF